MFKLTKSDEQTRQEDAMKLSLVVAPFTILTSISSYYGQEARPYIEPRTCDGHRPIIGLKVNLSMIGADDDKKPSSHTKGLCLFLFL